jgi:hypothetical protein
VADQSAEVEAWRDHPDFWRSFERGQFPGLIGQQVGKRICGARILIACAHHVHMAQPGLDGCLANGPEDPLDEPSRHHYGNDPKADGSDSGHASGAMTERVSKCQSGSRHTGIQRPAHSRDPCRLQEEASQNTVGTSSGMASWKRPMSLDNPCLWR